MKISPKQLELIIDKDNFEAFYDEYNLELVDDPDLAFLETEWWDFEIDRGIAEHRRKIFKENYQRFDDVRSAYREKHNVWLCKYPRMFTAWETINNCLFEIPLAEAQLSKPLHRYAKKKRSNEYSNEYAEKVRLLHLRLESAEKEMVNCLAIAETLPVLPDEINGLWVNVKLAFDMAKQVVLDANKPKKKRKEKEPEAVEIMVNVIDDSFEVVGYDLRKTLGTLPKGETIKTRDGSFDIGTIFDWVTESIRGYDDKLDKETLLYWQSNDRGFSLADAPKYPKFKANFYQNDADGKHTLVFNRA